MIHRLASVLFAVVVLLMTTGSTRMVIAATPLAPPPVADVQVEPREGPPGTTFVFHAAGYTVNERVIFWATAPDGSTAAASAGRTEAGGTGRAGWSWIAPSDAQPGTWVMVGRGQVSGVQQIILFGITSPGSVPTPVASTDVGVNPARGTSGARFAFHASGFKLGERVIFWATAPNGRSLALSDRAVALSDGRVEWSWLAPEDAPHGTWLMIAHGTESGIERVVRFEIV